MSDSKGSSTSKQVTDEVVTDLNFDLNCQDGVCRVKSRKLFAQAPDSSKLRTPVKGTRPMVDMLHGDVDLEHLFGG